MANNAFWYKPLQEKLRRNRFKQVDRIIRRLLETREIVSILDAGGRAVYWKLLAPDLRSRVKITVLNFQKELKNYDEQYMDLQISNVVGDACEMPEFDDGSFDLVHSNSVIEHVGSYRNMVKFANEVRRVGISYYVQTPFYWFPVDPHYTMPFIHWCSDPVKIFLFTRFKIGEKKCNFNQALFRVDGTKIIDRAMMRNFFPDGRGVNERFFLLTKSVAMIRFDDD